MHYRPSVAPYSTNVPNFLFVYKPASSIQLLHPLVHIVPKNVFFTNLLIVLKTF
jgi:hypothetical protein